MEMMKNGVIFCIVIFVSFSSMEMALAASNCTNKIYTNYIKTACNSTTYPSLCRKSLSSYASAIESNPLKLCNTALYVTIRTARNVSSLVTKLAKEKGLSPTEIGIITDCVENIGDSIDELNQSLAETNYLGGPDTELHLANMKTWVSAALTDEDTCTDGFDGRKVSSSVKKKIRKSVLNLAKMTSNALALLNYLRY
ncbi:pectinesterase inhibitor 4 [Carica papaya]|uniref:pectinesterase inhibitor 4 n=1 Tax=Carica papaya TaxID=3649 RepID=UPI000B8CD462|nr:pectinesterase inhibitor 4 [Carica papaya]